MVELAMAPYSSGASCRQSPSLQRSSRKLSLSTHHQNPTCSHPQRGNFLTGPLQETSPPQALQKQQQQQPQLACLQILPVAHYATLLQCCGKANSVLNGYLAHDLIVKSGFDRSILLQNMLIQMYGRCGYVEHACSSFSHMCAPDRYSWSFTIKCFAQQGNTDKAFQFFYHMQCVGMLPDEFVFVSVLSVCFTPSTLAEGMRVHAGMVYRLSSLDAVVGTALVNMYGKC
eukprot:c9901_g2_i1 orf=64-750(+)